MKFTIFTHIDHVVSDQVYGYGPYVNEMNIWLKYVDEVEVVGFVSSRTKDVIDVAYQHPNLKITPIPQFNITSVSQLVKTCLMLPKLVYVLYQSMKTADHIHLRCPGNVGLMACMVQILFPKKQKTAKYAGNWDLKAKQPWTYRLQKWILNNPVLTKNMQVLVYGVWPQMSVNIKPFFTATYSENDKKPVAVKTFESPIRLLFIGTLSPGKRPLYALQLIEALNKRGIACRLDFYGEGVERAALENYIDARGLAGICHLYGNQTKETVETALRAADFLVLPSKSEGWPKVIAEAMFWGCVPMGTPISCIPYMLDGGNRGLLLNNDLASDVLQIASFIEDKERWIEAREAGLKWSRKYTTDLFESEIHHILK